MPDSTIPRSPTTKMRSARRMVEGRWAIRKQVRPSSRRRVACWSRCSVVVSTLLVASSRMRIGARLTRARAMAKSWYCPWLNSPAAPDMRVWYPWGRRWMKPWAWASFAAWTTSASVASGRA